MPNKSLGNNQQNNMTHNTITKSPEEQLIRENNKNTEISREAQLKIIEKIEKWKKENHETGDRLKKYEGNTYPAHITDNTTDKWPLWRQLAGHVNFELLMVQYLHKKENPLDELLEMMLNSITRNVVNCYSLKGVEEVERKKSKEKEDKYKEKIERLLNETFPFDKLKEKPSQLSRFGISRCYLDTVNGIDYSNYIIDAYKEREEEFKKEVQELEVELKEKELMIEELEERVKIEQEEVKKFHQKSEEWNKWKTAEIVAKHDAREKELLRKIEILENNFDWLKNKEQIIKEYKDRELPALPKKQKQSRILKFKKLVNKVKEKTNEKFQAFIVQKSK